MGKVFLIKERTLRNLSRKVIVDPEFYERKETESEIVFKRKPLGPIEAAAAGVDHPWKITDSGSTDVDGNKLAAVAGGYLATQGAFGASSLWVDPVNPLPLVSGQPLVYLKITRDADTRELIDAEITSTIPTASITISFVVLGEWYQGVAVQRQFQDVNIHETMMVSNGSFVLVPVAMNGNNSFPLP